MPSFMEKALLQAKLMEAYRERPAYQQNDYIGWIKKAIRPETKEKRLNQMLQELKGGKLYMKMQWRKD